MYFLLKMGIFQPAMLAYQRVHLLKMFLKKLSPKRDTWGRLSPVNFEGPFLICAGVNCLTISICFSKIHRHKSSSTHQLEMRKHFRDVFIHILYILYIYIHTI